MTTLLLQTKLYIPPLRPNLVLRPHLIQRLNTGLHGKLTLISAPAGSGKTTLASEWASKLQMKPDPPVRAGWLSLDELDNETRRFFSHLVAALQQVDADIGRTARAAVETPERLSPVTLATTLINDIVALPHKIILVLDDYHVIQEHEIQEALRFVVDHQPQNLHLVITSRVDPDLPLSRLRARGQLTEIRSADLRFNETEILEFLKTAMPTAAKLSSEDVHVLAERTEGWIAGIQLATLSMPYQADISSFIQSLSGGSQYILDYLTDEVLRDWPRDIEEFLLQTSILDRLAAPLCDAVTGRHDSQRNLEALREANLLLIALDGEQRWYRYHHLFADALKVRLLRGAPEQVPELHRRASDWYLDNGFVVEAIHHTLAGEAFERAAELIEQFAQQLLFNVLAYVHVPTLLRWLDALPKALFRERPWLSASRGWALANTAQSEADLKEIEACLYTGRQALDDTSQDPVHQADDTLQGVLTALEAHLALARGDTSYASELVRTALELISEDHHQLRAGLFNVLGTAYWLSGQVLKASQAYEQSVRAAELCRQTFFRVSGLSCIAEMYKERGRLHQAAEHFSQAIQIATDEGWQSLPIAGELLVSLAEVLREWNRLEEALEYVQRGIKIGTMAGPSYRLLIIAHIVLARIRYAKGEQPGALAAIQEAESYAQQYELMGLKLWASAVQARLQLLGGELAAATRWVHDAALDPHDQAASRRFPGEYATLARCLIAQAQYTQALELLRMLRSDAEALGRMGRVIEALGLQAIALHLQGDSQSAQASLRAALELAEPEGFVRVFADEGQAMRALLRQAARDDPHNHYILRLLQAMPDDLASPDPNQLLLEPLSERELEVLGLIAAGLKNREIAGELVVTLGTVKAHINNIYGKLGVSTRVQAIERASALGILK
ncbi:MAG: tetratricopeptide repeat protein [Anaerolineales bacterium]|nr:MAG: tetratricopeptide repeat protein [Anaerolineales bacterium]